VKKRYQVVGGIALAQKRWEKGKATRLGFRIPGILLDNKEKGSGGELLEGEKGSRIFFVEKGGGCCYFLGGESSDTKGSKEEKKASHRRKTTIGKKEFFSQGVMPVKRPRWGADALARQSRQREREGPPITRKKKGRRRTFPVGGAAPPSEWDQLHKKKGKSEKNIAQKDTRPDQSAMDL